VPVNYIDETAWYQHGVLAGLRLACTLKKATVVLTITHNQAAFEALVKHWAGILVSDGYGLYCQWVHARQTCLAHLIRRARGLVERKDPELDGFGRWVLAELQRLVHWAQAPPTAGDVQTWYARIVHLVGCHRDRQDAAGTFAWTLERELGFLWTFVVEAGVDATNNRVEESPEVRRALAQARAGSLQREG
jgi:transposase